MAPEDSAPAPAKSMKLAHAFLLTFVSREATLAATFANAIILARGLGAEGLGSYLLVVAIANLLAQGFCLGLNYSNSIMVTKQPELAGMLFSTSILPLILYLPVAVALYMAAPWATGWMVGTMPSAQLCFLLVGTGVIVYTQNVGAVVFGLERYRIYSIALSLPALGLCLTDLVLWILGGLTVERVLLFWTLWNALGGAVLSLVLGRVARPSLRIDLVVFRRLVTIGGRALLCAIMGFSISRGLQIVLSRYHGTAAVGQYGALLAFSDLLGHAPGILSGILINRSSASTLSPSKIALLIRIHAVLSLAGGLTLGILAPLIITHSFGEAFARSPVALFILLAGSYFNGFWTLSASYFTGKYGYPLVVILFVALAAVLTLGSGFLLIPEYRLTGAAISWAAASTIVAGISMLMFQRTCRSEVGWKDFRPGFSDVATIRSLIGDVLRMRGLGTSAKRS
jgi:O-antigen/teichoic acid export membrane protein